MHFNVNVTLQTEFYFIHWFCPTEDRRKEKKDLHQSVFDCIRVFVLIYHYLKLQ